MMTRRMDSGPQVDELANVDAEQQVGQVPLLRVDAALELGEHRVRARAGAVEDGSLPEQVERVLHPVDLTAVLGETQADGAVPLRVVEPAEREVCVAQM